MTFWLVEIIFLISKIQFWLVIKGIIDISNIIVTSTNIIFTGYNCISDSWNAIPDICNDILIYNSKPMYK